MPTDAMTDQEQRYSAFRANLGDLRAPEVQVTQLRYPHKQSDAQKRTQERTRKWRAKQRKEK